MSTTQQRQSAADGQTRTVPSGRSPVFARRGQTDRGLPTRARSRGLITVAALLVVGFALVGATLYANAGQKTGVLAIGATGVAQGHVITRDDLRSVEVAGVRGAIEVDQVDTVVGKTATTGLVPGQILTTAMVTSTPVPGPGKALVGLSLDPGRYPAGGLAPGDQVQVIAVPAAGSDGTAVNSRQLDAPVTLAAAARVYSVQGSAASGGQQLVTVLAEARNAARLAAYSTAGQVALVETTAGGGH